MRRIAQLAALLVATACATSSPPPASVEVSPTGTPGKAGAIRTRSAAAKVKAVDAAARSITLENADGTAETLKVGPEVKRLGEIVPGDTLVVEVEEALLLEWQPPGSPTVQPAAAAAGGRSTSNRPPGGGVVAAVQGTVTVANIDQPSRIVTLRTLAGDTYRVKAGPGIQLERLQIGDRLLATYVETVAVSIVRAGQKL